MSQINYIKDLKSCGFRISEISKKSGADPKTVDEFEEYMPRHKVRLSMKPGLTGLWQVSGRSKITDFEEIVKLDTEYIENWSLKLDARILWRTVGVVLRHEGAE